jgi:hypothetical protein
MKFKYKGVYYRTEKLSNEQLVRMSAEIAKEAEKQKEKTVKKTDKK